MHLKIINIPMKAMNVIVRLQGSTKIQAVSKGQSSMRFMAFPMFTLENEDFCFKSQHYSYLKTTFSLIVDQLLLNLQSKSILGL